MVISSMKDKNEHINLWIIDSLRKENRAKSQKEKTPSEFRKASLP